MSANNNALFGDFDELFAGLDLGDTIAQNNAPIIEETGVTAQPINISESISIQQGNLSSLVPGAQAKLKMIEQEMNDNFVERDDVIKCMLLALVSGQSMLMLGMPGTARFDIAA